MGKLSIIEISSKPDVREILLDELCKGITNASDFRDACGYILDKKINLFKDPIFSDSLYEDEDSVSDLILPSFRRAWGRIYINIPDIFNPGKNHKDVTKKLELYQNYFDIDEFLDYLVEIFKNTKGCLSEFKFLDRTSEHLTLIVDNYISDLIYRVNNSEDIKEDLRNLKLKKIIK